MIKNYILNAEYKDFFNVTDYLDTDIENISYRKTAVVYQKKHQTKA